MGKRQRDCVDCGAPVGYRARQHCCRCWRRRAERAAKAPCPGCGKQRILQLIRPGFCGGSIAERRMPSGVGALCGDGVEGDSEAKRLELADEALALAVAIALGEVVAAQILVVALVGEQMPGDDQDRVADRDRGALFAEAAGQPPELGRQVGVAGVAGGPGALDEDLAEPAVAFGGPARVALASADVVAGAQAGPGGQVPGGWEHAHVDADPATRGRTLRVSLRNGGPTMSDV